VEAKVADAVDTANHGTGIEVAGLGMTENLATDALFCVENVTVTKVTWFRSARSQVSGSRQSLPMDICTSHRRNGWLSLELQYAPGRRGQQNKRRPCSSSPTPCKVDLAAVEGGHLANIVENGEQNFNSRRRRRALLGVTAKLAVKQESSRSCA
jgi:hypothetical protein